jgi:hypothetical protein
LFCIYRPLDIGDVLDILHHMSVILADPVLVSARSEVRMLLDITNSETVATKGNRRHCYTSTVYIFMLPSHGRSFVTGQWTVEVS